MIAVLFLFLLASVSLITYNWKFKRIIETSKNWPTPPTYPIIGNAHLFIGLATNDILMYFMDKLRKYSKNKCVKFWFGWEPCFFLANAADLEILMTSPDSINKATQYECLKDWLREGLLVSKGKKWHQRRKMLTPAFHFSILKDYVAVADKQSRIFVEKLKLYAKKKESFDIFAHVGLLALDVICETAMGVTIGAQDNANSEYVNAVKVISNIMHRRMFDIFHYCYLIHRFTTLHQQEKWALAILHGFTESVIQKRRAELLKTRNKNGLGHYIDISLTDDIGIRKKMSFLDILLKSTIDGNPLNDIEIREEVDTFMFEGHDTTTSTISFYFYNMAIYPVYQEKCFMEIIEVFGQHQQKSINFDDLNRLHFIELCIKETLRMYPAVPIIGRKTTKDIHISDGKIIPAGVNAGTLTLFVGRMDEYFPEANSFKPERFNVEINAEKMNPFAFIPFSAGQRNCIGQKFALLELKAIIVNVLRNFTVEFDGDSKKELHLTGELILRTKDPIMLKVRERVF